MQQEVLQCLQEQLVKMKKQNKTTILNIATSLILFSLFTGLLIAGAFFNFLEQWNLNPYLASIVLLVGAILSLGYLLWALFNWRLSRILK